VELLLSGTKRSHYGSKGICERSRYINFISSKFTRYANKLEGAAESKMLSFTKVEGTDGLWETVIIKAGFVISKDGRSPRDMMGWALGTAKSIRVDELAAAMINVAINGSKEDTLQDCHDLVMRGREALKNTK
jgi:hypothetical protein